NERSPVRPLPSVVPPHSALSPRARPLSGQQSRKAVRIANGSYRAKVYSFDGMYGKRFGLAGERLFNWLQTEQRGILRIFRAAIDGTKRFTSTSVPTLHLGTCP